MIELVALYALFFLTSRPIQISFHQNKYSVVNMPNFTAKF